MRVAAHGAYFLTGEAVPAPQQIPPILGLLPRLRAGYSALMPSTITVYTKSSCQACKLTYHLLEKTGIDYDVVDISQDPAALEYVQSLGYKSAPVVVAGEAHWDGFRPDRIKALVGN